MGHVWSRWHGMHSRFCEMGVMALSAENRSRNMGVTSQLVSFDVAAAWRRGRRWAEIRGEGIVLSTAINICIALGPRIA